MSSAFGARSLGCCAIRSPGAAADRPPVSSAPVAFIFWPSISISSGIKRFLPDKMLILVGPSGQRPFLSDVFLVQRSSVVDAVGGQCPLAQVLRNSFSGHRRRPATSQQRSCGLYFLALNQYFIQDKTISAGQNADFGGFLRSKAVSAGRFSSSVIKCRSCLRRSVPARSGAAQFVLRAPPPTGNQSAALQWSLFSCPQSVFHPG